MFQNDDDFNHILQHLQCQFLCTFPVKLIDFQPFARYTSWEQQKQMLDVTCMHPLNQQQPVKIEYQLSFLKYLLDVLEDNCTEVHDELYEKHYELQMKVKAQEQDKNFTYKHYVLPHLQTHFTLRESKSFVTAGTTGLCSWQASLALADYLLHHREIVSKKKVLELGAGTGLCGFITSRCCGAAHVSLTDGSLECIALMRENLSRNFSDASENSLGCFEVGEQSLNCWQLNWEAIAQAKVEDKIKPDVLLAADVVYDTAVLPDLSQAIDFIFKMMSNEVKMLLAATVRNEKTLTQYLELMVSMNFHITEQPVITVEKSHLHWDRSTPVKIFLITKNC